MLDEKKQLMEIFDPDTGEWVAMEMTEEEVENFQAMHEDDIDVLDAEYQIIQRSIAMHVGRKIDSKSTD